MLQDLDFLAARIGQLVKLTQTLRSDQSTLASRAEHAEQERDALREQLSRQEVEFKEIAAQAQRHESEMAQVRAESQTSYEALLSSSQRELDALRAQFESQRAAQEKEAQSQQARSEAELNEQKAVYARAIENLEQSRSETGQLRDAATSARQRIDAMLERLPGGAQE